MRNDSETELDELLADVDDTREHGAMKNLWQMLGELSTDNVAEPKMSRELQMTLKDLDMEDTGMELSDNELHNIAAAGTTEGSEKKYNTIIGTAGSGDDNVYGGSDDDNVYGGSGNDTVIGGSGDDIVDGGSGSDVVYGGTGDDTLSGGEGRDFFVFRPDDGDDVITDYTPGEDRIILNGVDAGAYEISYDEESGSSIITYEGGSITLQGQELDPGDLFCVSSGTDGDDNMTGGEGNDYLYGGAGNDVYVWSPDGDGNDLFDGGEGEDSILLDMESSSIRDALNSGEINLHMYDADNNPVYITSDMFDDDGNLSLPEGLHGTITCLTGEENVLTFNSVERIGTV